MRQIKTTKTFDKKLLKLVQYDADLADKLGLALHLLERDLKDNKLKTHKLKGDLKNFYSCSVTHSIRIVFTFDNENIYLDTIGTHDEVY